MLNWLLEKDIFERDEELTIEIQRQGMTSKYADKLSLISDPYKLFPPGSDVIFRGSLHSVYNVNQCQWHPGALCNNYDYNFSVYSSAIGEYLLNDKYHLLTISELIRRRDELIKYYGTELLFIKPDSGYKTFPAKPRDITKSLPDNGTKLVVVSPIKKILNEWRFFIGEKQVITGSMYMKGGELYQEEERSAYLAQYVENIASNLPKDFVSEEIFTIDICEDSKDELYVLEINSFSCSGLYQCNLTKIVEAVKLLLCEE